MLTGFCNQKGVGGQECLSHQNAKRLSIKLSKATRVTLGLRHSEIALAKEGSVRHLVRIITEMV